MTAADLAQITWLLPQDSITTAKDVCWHAFAGDSSLQIKTYCTANIVYTFMLRIWRAAQSSLLLSRPWV